MRPRRRQVFAEQRVGDEDQRHDRHDPAGRLLRRVICIVMLLRPTRGRPAGSCRRGADLHRLRAVRQIPAAAVDASRLHLRAPRRPSLHDVEGVFGTTVEVSSSLIILSRFSARCCNIPAPASSSSISRSPPWAASAMPPAAPSCSPPSCWAGHRARAWPPPSPSAPSPTRC